MLNKNYHIIVVDEYWVALIDQGVGMSIPEPTSLLGTLKIIVPVQLSTQSKILFCSIWPLLKVLTFSDETSLS